MLVELPCATDRVRECQLSDLSPGWIVAHLTNGLIRGPRRTGRFRTCECGTRLDLLVAMTYITVAAVDPARSTVRLQIDTPWFANPSAAVAWQKDRLDILGLGSDWQMYHKAWANAAWHPPNPRWETIGRSFISPPAIVSWSPARLDVFGLGRDRSLYHKPGWKPLGSIADRLGTAGRCFRQSPAVASWGPNRLDIFGVGADYAMFHKAWDGQTWYPSPMDWQSLGGGFRIQDPVTATSGTRGSPARRTWARRRPTRRRRRGRPVRSRAPRARQLPPPAPRGPRHASSINASRSSPSAANRGAQVNVAVWAPTSPEARRLG